MYVYGSDDWYFSTWQWSMSLEFHWQLSNWVEPLSGSLSVTLADESWKSPLIEDKRYNWYIRWRHIKKIVLLKCSYISGNFDLIQGVRLFLELARKIGSITMMKYQNFEKKFEKVFKKQKLKLFLTMSLIEAHKTRWDWKTILNVPLNVPLNETHKTTWRGLLSL